MTNKVRYHEPEAGFVDGIYSYEDGGRPCGFRHSEMRLDEKRRRIKYLADYRRARARRNYVQ